MEAVGPNTDWISLLQCIVLLATAPGFVRMVFRATDWERATAYTCLAVRTPQGRATDSGMRARGTIEESRYASFIQKTFIWHPEMDSMFVSL